MGDCDAGVIIRVEWPPRARKDRPSDASEEAASREDSTPSRLPTRLLSGRTRARISVVQVRHANPPLRTALVEPLAPKRYRIELTVDAETYENLRLAQELASHAIPRGDIATIFARGLKLFLEDLAKTRCAATEQPRPSRETAPGSRHIPAAVKRTVWLRDRGRCAFVAKSGRRCAERRFLEYHHLIPYAMGGEATVENIQVRCKMHNQYESELEFGPRTPVVREEPAPYLRLRRDIATATRSGPSSCLIVPPT